MFLIMGNAGFISSTVFSPQMLSSLEKGPVCLTAVQRQRVSRGETLGYLGVRVWGFSFGTFSFDKLNPEP